MRRVEQRGAAAVRAGHAHASRWRPPFPLDEVEQAYERFQAGGKLGKVVLLP